MAEFPVPTRASLRRAAAAVIPEPACPNQAKHTLHPSGYLWHSEWAEQLLLTHDQRECPGCGTWSVWEVQAGVTDLVRPALYSGDCSGCGGYYAEGALIRTDGAGGWVAACCPETEPNEVPAHV